MKKHLNPFLSLLFCCCIYSPNFFANSSLVSNNLEQFAVLRWGMTYKEASSLKKQNLEVYDKKTILYNDTLYQCSVEVVLKFDTEKKVLTSVACKFVDASNLDAERVLQQLKNIYGVPSDTTRNEQTKFFMTFYTVTYIWINPKEEMQLIVVTRNEETKGLALRLLHR